MGNLVNCCIGEDEEGKRYFGRYEVNQAPDEGRYGYYHHHHLSCLKQDPPHKFSHSMIIRARAPLYTVSALLTNAPADAGAAAPITAAPSRTALSGVAIRDGGRRLWLATASPRAVTGWPAQHPAPASTRRFLT